MDWKDQDERWSVTLDEVVARAVGIEFQYRPANYGVEVVEDTEDLDIDIDAIEILREELSQLQSKLHEQTLESEASIGDISNDLADERNTTRQLERKLEDTENRLRIATQISRSLKEKVAIANGAHESELIFLPDDLSRIPAVTKHSAYSWLIRKFGITIQDWAPPKPRPNEKDTPDIRPTSKARNTREDVIENYQRIVEGLVALLLEGAAPSKYLVGGNVNQKKVAENIRRVLSPHPRNEEIPAQNTIQKKLRACGVGSIKAPKQTD